MLLLVGGDALRPSPQVLEMRPDRRGVGFGRQQVTACLPGTPPLVLVSARVALVHRASSPSLLRRAWPSREGTVESVYCRPRGGGYGQRPEDRAFLRGGSGALATAV